MIERTCTKCGLVMEVIKNGFSHLGPDGGIRSGDLWYCHSCAKFQIHGIPHDQHPWWPIFGLVTGERTSESETFFAYLEPQIHFLPAFYNHIKQWHPELKLKTDEYWYI